MTVLYKIKLCFLGALGVGKTSICTRIADDKFSENTKTTLGLSILEKDWKLDDQLVRLVLWDMQGIEGHEDFLLHILEGAWGYFLVIDGTRKETYKMARKIHQMATEKIGSNVPFLAVLNKSDMRDDWEITSADLEEMATTNWKVLLTSARDNKGIRDAVDMLIDRAIKRLS